MPNRAVSIPASIRHFYLPVPDDDIEQKVRGHNGEALVQGEEKRGGGRPNARFRALSPMSRLMVDLWAWLVASVRRCVRCATT